MGRCGGYFVRQLNDSGGEFYVSRIDVSALPDVAAAQARGAPNGELLVRGHLGSPEPPYGEQVLIVVEAYRGMPGVSAADGDGFYTATAGARDCPDSLCTGGVAHLVNRDQVASFDAVDVDPAAKPWVDRAWLTARIRSHGAIVAGRLGDHDGKRALAADQIFVRLPNLVGPCPPGAEPACAPGTEPTYERTDDLCVEFAACVNPSVCPMFLPECATGYQLHAWPEGTSGCKKFACDPVFGPSQ
jgi:hypothetical protein